MPVSSIHLPGSVDKDFQSQGAEEEGTASRRNLQQHINAGKEDTTAFFLSVSVFVLCSISLEMICRCLTVSEADML